MKKLFNMVKNWDYRIKFLIVGGLNTFVGFAVYLLVLLMFGVNIFNVDPSLVVPVVVATLISQVVGLIHSYFWNKYFTFESKKKDKIETIKFVIVYLVAFAVDYVLKLTLRKVNFLNEILIALITTLTTMIISFVGQKVFVFKYKKQKNLQQKEE